MEAPFIRYVGDPFVDTGAAVLEHRIGKACEEFLPEDIERQGNELQEIYSQRGWRSILAIHFPNSGWTNPNMGQAKVAAYYKKVLSGFNEDVQQGRFCEYCRRPANTLVDGSTIPLLSNANSMDCGAGGRTGFGVCGYCLFAVQFYPLATLKIEGRALFWWSPDRQWTYLLAGIAVREVNRFLAVSPEGTINPKFPRTQLLRVAREAFTEWSNQPDRIPLRDIIGCRSTNYRTEPEFDELRMPKALFEFWYEAASGYGATYDALVAAAWEAKAPKKNQKGIGKSEWQRRNGLYEALGKAFQADDFGQAIRAAMRYFIRIEGKKVRPGSFGLACLFLERLAGMTKLRIDAIREIADQVSKSSASKKLLTRLFESPTNFTDWLVYAQRTIEKAGEPCFRFDSILAALDMVSEDDSMPRDFWLVRNLIILRALEAVDDSVSQELPEPVLQSAVNDDKEG